MICKLVDAICIRWATLWPSGGYRNAGVCPGRRRKGGKRRLLHSRVAGTWANFRSRRVGTRRRRYDKKAGDWIRCAARCSVTKSCFRARSRLAPPDRHRERRQRRRILTAPLHASEFVCHLSVNGCVSRKMWRLHATRDFRRLRTAAPAVTYVEGDPEVIRVECRGQPLRWRESVSTLALTEEQQLHLHQLIAIELI